MTKIKHSRPRLKLLPTWRFLKVCFWDLIGISASSFKIPPRKLIHYKMYIKYFPHKFHKEHVNLPPTLPQPLWSETHPQKQCNMQTSASLQTPNAALHYLCEDCGIIGWLILFFFVSSSLLHLLSVSFLFPVCTFRLKHEVHYFIHQTTTLQVKLGLNYWKPGFYLLP